MLKLLRKHRKGLFGGVVLGLVCLTMIGFGIDFFADRGSRGEVIRVNDTEISSVEYYQRLNQLRNRYRNQFGAQFDRIAAMLNLEQQTVDQLINTELLQNLLTSLGLQASPREIRAKIESHPFFQGQKPTRQTYRSLTRALGMTGKQLEQITAQELAAEQLLRTMNDITVLSDRELKAAYRDANREASFYYVEFAPASYTDEVTVDNDEALQAYYIDHEERYRKPRAVRFTAVLFSPEEFLPEVELTEEDVVDAYERNKQKFAEEKKVTFRRIIFRKNQQGGSALEELVTGSAATDEEQKQAAEAALARLSEGESFAEVAKAVSEDKSTKQNGGLVDWTEFSVLKAELRNALNELEVGAHSEVIETDDAFYIVAVEGVREKRTPPLSEVRDTVEETLRKEFAPEYARAAAENFIDLFEEESAKNDLTLEQFAEVNNRTVISSGGLLSRGEAAEGLSSEVTAEALTMAEQQTQVVQSSGTPLVLQVVEIKSSHIPEFDAVRKEVASDYQTAEAARIAEERAKEALVKLAENQDSDPKTVLSNIATSNKTELKSSSSGTRNSIQDPVISLQPVRQRAFALSQSTPIASELVEANGSFYLLGLASESIKEGTDFEASRSQLLQAEKQQAAARLEEVLVQELRSESDIWVEPNLLEEAAG